MNHLAVAFGVGGGHFGAGNPAFGAPVNLGVFGNAAMRPRTPARRERPRPRAVRNKRKRYTPRRRVRK
jgi:hypothetical protein